MFDAEEEEEEVVVDSLSSWEGEEDEVFFCTWMIRIEKVKSPLPRGEKGAKGEHSRDLLNSQANQVLMGQISFLCSPQ